MPDKGRAAKPGLLSRYLPNYVITELLARQQEAARDSLHKSTEMAEEKDKKRKESFLTIPGRESSPTFRSSKNDSGMKLFANSSFRGSSRLGSDNTNTSGNDGNDITAEPTMDVLQDAAVLVADISGFTKLNERFAAKKEGAEQVTDHLNRYFTRLLNVIEMHGGDCVKFAGDALIVLFSRRFSDKEKAKVNHIAHITNMVDSGFYGEEDLKNDDDSLPMHSKSLKEGWVEKCSASFDNWRQRYLVLFDDSIVYYPKKYDSEPSGIIHLYSSSIVQLESDNKFPEHSFSVTPYNGKRKYVLSCISSEQREEWIAAIRTRMENLHFKVVREPVMEGWLQKKGGLFSGWEPRYCILSHTSLQYFKRKHDQEPLETIPLTIETKVSQISDKNFILQELTHKNNKKVQFQASNKTERDGWVAGIQWQLPHMQSSNRLISNTSMWDTEAEDDGEYFTPGMGVHVNSVREGWLFKPEEGDLKSAGGKSVKWARRYFILYDHGFFYWINKKSALDNLDPLGIIELTPSSAVTPIVDSWGHHPFSIQSTLGSNPIQLAALGMHNRRSWIDCLKMVLPTVDQALVDTVDPLSIREGWLIRHGMMTWDKLFFVLRPGKLFYFNNKRDARRYLCDDEGDDTLDSQVDDRDVDDLAHYRGPLSSISENRAVSRPTSPAPESRSRVNTGDIKIKGSNADESSTDTVSPTVGGHERDTSKSIQINPLFAATNLDTSSMLMLSLCPLCGQEAMDCACNTDDEEAAEYLDQEQAGERDPDDDEDDEDDDDDDDYDDDLADDFPASGSDREGAYDDLYAHGNATDKINNGLLERAPISRRRLESASRNQRSNTNSDSEFIHFRRRLSTKTDYSIQQRNLPRGSTQDKGAGPVGVLTLTTRSTISVAYDEENDYAFSITTGQYTHTFSTGTSRVRRLWMQSLKYLIPKLNESNDTVKIQTDSTLRAVQCALELQSAHGVYVAEGVELTLHIGVGAGDVYALNVGGHDNEWEFLIAGNVFEQLSRSVDFSKKGEVIVSDSVVHYILDRMDLDPSWKSKHSKAKAYGEEKVLRIKRGVPPMPVPPIDLPRSALEANFELANAMRAYLSRCILDKVDHKQSSWLCERRTATVIFVNLRGLVLSASGLDSEVLRLTHEVCWSLQNIIARNKGYRRQFLVDDKGTVLIAVFGVPPFASEQDAYRGVKSALQMRETLLNLGIEHSMGIATGEVFVGSVGSPTRQEHAVVGDTVNSSARLSGKARDGGILCDHRTYRNCRSSIRMREEGEIAVKGKTRKIRIYTPVGFEKETSLTMDLNSRLQEKKVFLDMVKRLQKSNKGGVMLVEGESGIGKTQLMTHFYRRALPEINLRVINVCADPVETGTPLALFTHILEQLISLDQSTSIRQRTKRVTRWLAKQNMRTDQEVVQLFPVLNYILGTAIPQTEQTKAITDESGLVIAARKVILSLMDHVISESEENILMLVEDAHLFDPLSQMSLTELGMLVQPSKLRLLLVISARPPAIQAGVEDNSFNWSTARNNLSDIVGLKLLTLQGLDLDQCRQIVYHQLKGTSGVKSSGVGSMSTVAPLLTNRGSETNLDAIEDVKLDANLQGWLKKKRGRWQKRYFVMKRKAAHNPGEPGAELQYFKSDTAVVMQKSIPISCHTIVTNDYTCNEGCGFTIEPKLGGRKYVLCAQLEEDREKWVSSLRRLIKEFQVEVNPELQVAERERKLRVEAKRQMRSKKTVSHVLMELIMSRSHGNPFFVTEVVRHLVMAKMIKRDADGEWTLAATEQEVASVLPQSLKGLLLHRVDSLPPDAALLCKFACMFGLEFEKRLLFRLWADDTGEDTENQEVRASFDASLAQLTVARVVQVKSQYPTLTYEFCHQLLQNACLDLIPYSRRAELYHKIALLHEEYCNSAAAATRPSADAATIHKDIDGKSTTSSCILITADHTGDDGDVKSLSERASMLRINIDRNSTSSRDSASPRSPLSQGSSPSSTNSLKTPTKAHRGSARHFQMFVAAQRQSQKAQEKLLQQFSKSDPLGAILENPNK